MMTKIIGLLATPIIGISLFQMHTTAPKPKAITTVSTIPSTHYQLQSITKWILDVPHIQQLPELPRGCEVTSLAMLLQDAGVHVDKVELANKLRVLPYRDSNGVYGNMHEGFVGDMYHLDTGGIGVFAEPIYNLGKQYLGNRLINLTKQPVSAIYDAIENGSPVWVITTSTFSPLQDSDFLTWNTSQGQMKVTYRQHSVVVTGFDSDYVYVNDPLSDTPNTRVNRKLFEEAWIQMGSQAIAYSS